jgi:cytochrome c556
MRRVAALLGALLALAGCAGSGPIRYERRLEEVPAPAAHAIHDERLEQVMRGLERLQVERLPQALDLGQERERRTAELVEVALALAGSAERIRAVAPALGLDGADREAFLDLASQLEERARDLAEGAPRLPPEALRDRARSVGATCNACHERFLAGPPPGGSP